MLISVEDVSHSYQEDGDWALKDISLEIAREEFIGLIGHTGSGKSTLVQLFNGLITPTTGRVTIDGIELTEKDTKLKQVRQKVGLVFQYPEHQLFEETIYSEVAFGPGNLGLSNSEKKHRVREALELVGLDFEKFRDRSPFNLSGGQQRKVAIAGVLAMKPEVLILDEPSAGLDPRGREHLIELLYQLYQEYQMTIILISHRMEEIARLASRVIVMDHGRVVSSGTPAAVFRQVDRVKELALDLPEIMEIMIRLRERGLEVRTEVFSVEEAVEEILPELRRKNKC